MVLILTLSVSFACVLANAGASDFKIDFNSAIESGLGKQDKLSKRIKGVTTKWKMAAKKSTSDETVSVISVTRDLFRESAKQRIRKIDTSRDIEREVAGL